MHVGELHDTEAVERAREAPEQDLDPTQGDLAERAGRADAGRGREREDGDDAGDAAREEGPAIGIERALDDGGDAVHADAEQLRSAPRRKKSRTATPIHP